MRKIAILSLLLLAPLFTGCTHAGLFSKGQKPVVVTTPDGNPYLDPKTGKPTIVMAPWESWFNWPSNLKDVKGAAADDKGARTEEASNFQMPESKTLLIILAGLCIGVAFILYTKGLTDIAYGLAITGGVVVAVPYIMPEIGEAVRWLALVGGLAFIGIYIWRKVVNQGKVETAKVETEKARDKTALLSFGKAVAEGRLSDAILIIRDYDPDANQSVLDAKAAGVKPPAPTPV